MKTQKNTVNKGLIGRIANRLELGLSFESACRLEGASPRNIELARQADDWIDQTLAEGEARNEQALVAILSDAARKDGKLALAILERKHAGWAGKSGSVNVSLEHKLAGAANGFLAKLAAQRAEQDKLLAVDVEVVPPAQLAEASAGQPDEPEKG